MIEVKATSKMEDTNKAEIQMEDSTNSRAGEDQAWDEAATLTTIPTLVAGEAMEETDRNQRTTLVCPRRGSQTCLVCRVHQWECQA